MRWADCDNRMYLLLNWNKALQLKFHIQSEFLSVQRLISLFSFLVMCCGSDNINGLCPTWSSKCIVALLTDPRSVWCVKSIYLNLFACIGIWRRASCFHLMFFVLNTDKQARFCAPLSFGLSLSLSQPIFYSVGFQKKQEYVTLSKIILFK